MLQGCRPSYRGDHCAGLNTALRVGTIRDERDDLGAAP